MGAKTYDKNWNTVGRLSDDGKTLYDKDWNTTGHVSDDGKTIYDKNWNTVGRLSDDGKALYDKDWNTTGHVSDDGRILFDRNWDVAGHREGGGKAWPEQLKREEKRRDAQFGGAGGESIGDLLGEGLGALFWSLLVFALKAMLFVFGFPILALIFAFGSRDRKRRMWHWIGAVASFYCTVFVFAVAWYIVITNVPRELLARFAASRAGEAFSPVFSVLTIPVAIGVYFIVKRWLNR